MKQLIFFVILLPLALSQSSRRRCGGNRTASFETVALSSPNYPRNHPNNLNCWWFITSSTNRNIMFVLTDLNTERCCDFVEVYDGPTRISQFRGQTTGDIPIITTGTELRVRFRSDSSVSKSGFRATYREVNNCGHAVNVTSGVTHISTPFFPQAHPPNLDCYWTILATDARQQAEVTIERGRTDDCCDFLEIFDGSRSLGRYKGNLTQRSFSSTERQLNIYFHSESTSLLDGFSASVKQHECGGTFNINDGESRIITSPNYPNATGHNLNCSYILHTEIGYSIELSIEVDTEPCCDYVQVWDGKKSLGRLRGKVPKSSIVSTGRNIRMMFHTDGSVQSKGFTATYRRILPSCGDLYVPTFQFQTLTSPGYPNVYPNNYRCDWIIQTVSENQILLLITDFLTETCCDYLEIFDGQISAGQLRGSIKEKFSVVSQSNTLRIRLTTDESTRKKGFRAMYKLAKNCGRTLSASSVSGTVRTPNYPNDYQDNLDCMWIIQSTDNTEIFLNITEGETEPEHDFVQILDGLTPVARLTGLIPQQTITSTGTSLRVYFHSDKTATRNGFSATYEQTCDYYYNVTQETQFFSSPNYPNRSPHNYKCNYHLIAPLADQRIQVTVVQFSTESCCDSVKLYDGESSLLHTLRDTIDRGRSYFSTINTMRISYTTDGSVASLGFQFSFRLASQ